MLGEVIKDYMKQNGIKQMYVSEKTGIRPQILGQMLLGKRKIEATELFSICEALGVNPVTFAEQAGIYKKEKTTI